MTFSLSDKGLDMICSFETFEPRPYQDGGGLWSIGYGTRISGPAQYPNGITQTMAMEFLEEHIDGLLPALNQLNFSNLTQNQQDAIIDFVYNIGINAFTSSHVYSALSKQSFLAFNTWVQWVHDARGNTEPGLVTRRNAEVKLFIFGVYPNPS